MKIFRCQCFVHIQDTQQSKLDSKSWECVKGFKLWDAILKKFIVNIDVILDEESILKSGWLHFDPVKGKVDKNMNIVSMKLDLVGNVSTKLSVEMEHPKPS